MEVWLQGGMAVLTMWRCGCVELCPLAVQGTAIRCTAVWMTVLRRGCLSSEVRPRGGMATLQYSYKERLCRGVVV